MAAVWRLLLCSALVCQPFAVQSEFDCGEGKGIEDSFVCDGDADCFLSLDESDEQCPSSGSKLGASESKIRWLAKFLEAEYIQVGGCGQPAVLPKFRERRIVGGEEAIRGSWPWQTALVNRDVQLVYCAGSLIHREWVVTAAHCVESLKGGIENLELWFGKHDVTNKEIASQRRRASAMYKHVNHRYPNHKSNDIALIKLSDPVEVSSYVKLICLPTKVEQRVDGNCYLAGWGRVSDPREPIQYPAELLQLWFPMVPHKLCTDTRAWGPRITNKQICAGGDGEHDMCWGDSGGGLVCSNQGRYTLKGISSFTGHLCAVENRPAIFTKVDRYLGWLSDILRNSTL